MEPGLQREHIFWLTGNKEKYWQLFPSKPKVGPGGEKKMLEFNQQKIPALEKKNQRKDTEGHI